METGLLAHQVEKVRRDLSKEEISELRNALAWAMTNEHKISDIIEKRGATERSWRLFCKATYRQLFEGGTT